MRRLLLGGLCAAALTAWSTTPAEAASIVPCTVGGANCVAIAEFSWVIDGFGDTFELENLSAALIAADFTAATVLVDGVDNLPFPDDPLVASGITSTFPFSSALSSAAVSFTYQGSMFGATIGFGDLVSDPLLETTFFSTFVYAERVAPEPSTLALVFLGAAGLLQRRRLDRRR